VHLRCFVFVERPADDTLTTSSDAHEAVELTEFMLELSLERRGVEPPWDRSRAEVVAMSNCCFVWACMALIRVSQEIVFFV
jgi:hypothetical protein